MKYIRLWRFLALLVLVGALYALYKGVTTHFFFNLGMPAILLYTGLFAVALNFLIIPTVRWLINPTPLDL